VDKTAVVYDREKDVILHTLKGVCDVPPAVRAGPPVGVAR